ncbi:glycosyltransferase family 4 protein [Bermanella marisrubri]|uniref:Glycosyltransferase n=1 Tax=Bermanella marisrubri TaxID=207949 RepID=Q1MZG4_9GAMM|nr:glycosyltransferase family 4 protein [Bermanella marisrubri]EAT11302.1 hypothetical protein RED65_12782 [Oceanobacter sp. RED65] [Bermanella marisrubri]QIZ85309.1 glycosyltransferase family 4 protein [Bermanella marisrubri]
MKTLLVIGYVWPEPNSSAAGSRMMQLIQSFQAMDYQVHYASPAQASDHAIDFASQHITPHAIKVNNSSFDSLCRELEPDAVLFDRFMMEEQFSWRVEKVCPNALRVLDTEDLHCLRFTRQRLAKGNQDVVDTVDLQQLMQDERCVRELAAIYRCDITLMISQFEMTLLQDSLAVPADLLHYTPFMLTEDQCQMNTTEFQQRQHFVSIGNFRHEPNWDAVLQLKQVIWPLIRRSLPKAELHIYGAYPPKKATQLHNPKQGFLVKGWCENAQEMVSQARVLLAPLRFGAGLKGKIIEAAQCGTPAVTTSIGIEGISDTQEKNHAVVHDDFAHFAQAAIELYSNQDTWQQRHGQCTEVLSKFKQADHQQSLVNRLNQLSSQLVQHRLQNIVGTILRHHSMKSTQYMSQWIESKNQLAKLRKSD